MAVDKLVDSTQLDADLTSVANAIRTKGGTSAQLAFPADFVQAIGDIQTGGDSRPTAPNNDVVYIDYDGHVLYSYTAAEFANLTAHPAHPTPPLADLTADDWNWTLAGAKSYVAKYKQLVIGQTYSPPNNTSIFVIDTPGEGQSIELRFRNETAGESVSTDWGDGSEIKTLSDLAARANALQSHTYSNPGVYVVKRHHTGACTINEFFCTMNEYRGGRSIPKMVFFDSNISIQASNTKLGQYRTSDAIGFAYGWTGTGASMFLYSGLRAIILPKGAKKTASTGNWFDNSHGLEYVSFPESFEGIAVSSVFYNCYGLRKICLDETGTKIEASAFFNCFSVTRIDIPSSVTSIAANAFNGCWACLEYHFHSTTPPTIANANAWGNTHSLKIIYVPTGSLSAYQNATNYPSSSTATYVEE